MQTFASMAWSLAALAMSVPEAETVMRSAGTSRFVLRSWGSRKRKLARRFASRYGRRMRSGR